MAQQLEQVEFFIKARQNGGLVRKSKKSSTMQKKPLRVLSMIKDRYRGLATFQN
jgi:hypothetical protein